MIFNKSFTLLSNDIILSAAEVLPESISSEFLFSNYYALNKNYFSRNNENLIVLQNIKCNIKMYANLFRLIRLAQGDTVSLYPNIKLIVERNDTVITIIDQNFNSLLQPMIEFSNIELKKNDIIKCYAKPHTNELHSIAGYSIFLT